MLLRLPSLWTFILIKWVSCCSTFVYSSNSSHLKYKTVFICFICISQYLNINLTDVSKLSVSSLTALNWLICLSSLQHLLHHWPGLVYADPLCGLSANKDQWAHGSSRSVSNYMWSDLKIALKARSICFLLAGEITFSDKPYCYLKQNVTSTTKGRFLIYESVLIHYSWDHMYMAVLLLEYACQYCFRLKVSVSFFKFPIGTKFTSAIYMVAVMPVMVIAIFLTFVNNLNVLKCFNSWLN